MLLLSRGSANAERCQCVAGGQACSLQQQDGSRLYPSKSEFSLEWFVDKLRICMRPKPEQFSVFTKSVFNKFAACFISEGQCLL